jgi:DNA-binding MarR family transcriptional regulator
MVSVSPTTAALELSVTRLAHVLLRELEPGLSRTSLSVLARLREAGPTRVTELALAESVAQPSMTALVGRLSEQGLVERRHDPLDGRVVLVAVTDEGRSRLQARQQARAAMLEKRLERLDLDERHLLDRVIPLLERLAA